MLPRPNSNENLLAGVSALADELDRRAVAFRAPSTGALTLTTAAQDVTGASIRLAAPGLYLVFAVFDFNITLAGAGVCVGELVFDGTTQSEQALLAEAAVRGTVAQTYLVTAKSGGVTAKLQGRKTINAGTAAAQTPHTTITATRIS